MGDHPRYGKQRGLTKYFLAHPYLGALWSVLAVGVWTTVIVGDWRASAAVFVGMLALVILLWGPRGPARRREERLYPGQRED